MLYETLYNLCYRKPYNLHCKFILKIKKDNVYVTSHAAVQHSQKEQGKSKTAVTTTPSTFKLYTH